MSPRRDQDGFEVEQPTYTQKVTWTDLHSATSTTVIFTNDDASFRGMCWTTTSLPRDCNKYLLR